MADSEQQAPAAASTEQEIFELSTTIDPSYIIKLIRQLLPTVYIKEVDRCPSENMKHSLKKGGACHAEAAFDDRLSTLEKVQEHSGSHERALNLSREEADAHASDSVEHRGRMENKNVENSSFLDNGHEVAGSLKSDNATQSPLPSQKDMDPTVPDMGASDALEEQREEAGCLLWDLAADQSHAEFMVNHQILDVLLAILDVTHTDRLREICLGIMGNLACHAAPVKAIVQTKGLQSKIVQSLFVDDAPSLSEACRLLSAGLHSEEVDNWVGAIESREVLERIIWITSNTMNSLLLEKSTELLLAIVDCQGNAASALITVLVQLGLPAVLTDLLASEIDGLNEGNFSHGSLVLDTLLQIAEALSLADDVATQLAASLKLFTLACQVIQLSGKDEVGPAGISAAVLVANLLAEEESLIREIVHNAVLVKKLLKLLPTATDDSGARNALWSILDRLTHAYWMSSKDFLPSSDVLLVLAESSSILLEDVQEHQGEEMIDKEDELQNAKDSNGKLETINRFLLIMENWTGHHDCGTDNNLHRTITSSCNFLKRKLQELELDGASEHDQSEKCIHTNTPNKTEE